jgi:UDP-glucose 4-epimerase
MTVLITGGAGYIGSHMVHALVNVGERPVVLDNLATGFDWAVARNASLVIGDCGDQSRVAALIAEHGVDSVVHFAASTVVPDSVRDPLGYYRNNTVNSHALIETAVKRGAPFHLLLDGSSLRQPRAHVGARGRSYCADLALRFLEADDRDHAA